MKNTMHRKGTWFRRSSITTMVAILAGTLNGASAQDTAAPATLAEFKLDEGTGSTIKSAVGTLTGNLGPIPNPDAQPVSTTDSPSGLANDRAVQLGNGAFLVVDDSVSPLLAQTTGKLTFEGWVKRDSAAAATATYQGVFGYGGAYKVGFQGDQLIFTLFGIVDIPSGLFVNADEWHHVAVAWDAGVGVTFFVDGTEAFVEETRAVGPFLNNYLNLGAERLGTPFFGSLDRLRIHQGLLTADQLDTTATAPKAALATTIVAYSFDQATLPYPSAGPTARPAVSGIDFVNIGVAPVWDTDSPTGSATDRSLNFKNAGMRAVIPDPDLAIALETGDFTVQAWAKFGSQPAARSVLVFNNGPGAAFSFSVSGRKLFVTTLGILDQPSNAAIPDDGGWHHLAVVHENGKEFRFFVDGILGDTIAYTRGVLIGVRTDTNLYLGSEPTGGLPYVGKLDRVSITRGVLSADKLDFRPIPGVDPQAPTLTIRTVVEISWPSLPAGYQLQTTLTPENAASWSDVQGTPTASEGTYRFYVPVAAEKSFYRLIKP